MPVRERKLNTRSFVRGMARVLDLRGTVDATYARRHSSRVRSDHAAIASDWQAVWSDLGAAFSRVTARETTNGRADEREARAW
jgi:hypothetical protein